MIKNKIAYIARASVPSNSTNSIHVAKISDAFASISRDFVLIVFGGDTKANLRDCYGIKNDFPVLRIKEGNIGRFSQIKWAFKAIGLARRNDCNVVVTRDPFCAIAAVMNNIDVVLDLHGDIKHLSGRFYRMLNWRWFVDNQRLHIVTITKGLKEFYISNYKMNEQSITVLPDGADVDDFYPHADKKLEVDRDSLQIGYFGKILIGKGIDLIRKLALNDRTDTYHIYGGTEAEAQKETGEVFPQNVIFHGRVNNSDVPSLMCDMDVLLLPNQEEMMVMGENIGNFTSPLKMFEYMASGRCIIASDLPVIREVLDNSNAYLANSINEYAWIECLEDIKKRPYDAVKKANKARQDVLKYTWKKRAQAMLELTSK